MLIALFYVINTATAYIGIDIPVLSNIAGMSLLTWIFMYLSAIVFRFCLYHRMFLYYILATDIINIIDYYVGIPITNFELLMLHSVITGVSLFIILYAYVKNHKKPVGEDSGCDIDAGNSNITEDEATKLIDTLKELTDKEKRLSKYAACEYLNVSRVTFDNYVREGKLPKGKHEIGFKELSWSKKDLDEFIRKSKPKSQLA
jgi:predicted DNA-binding transcriptional regulator AlpA